MAMTLTMNEVPKVERPRERMLFEGPEACTNQDLIAILLGSGTKKESVLELSNRVISHFNGIRLLEEATIQELTALSGIGEAKAVQLRAAIELGKRIRNYPKEMKYVIRSPKDASDFVMEDMRTLTQEHFVCLFLSTKNQVIHRQTIFIGSLNMSVVHPREIFKAALRYSAASMICIHNHPSGDTAPSQEDIDVTKRLVEVGKTIGIEVLDHVIIGDHSFCSLKEKGYV